MRKSGKLQPNEQPEDERRRLIDEYFAEVRGDSLASIRRLVKMRSFLSEAKATRLATFIKASQPELTDTEIADMVGVDRSTLYRDHEYRRLKAILTAKSDFLRGEKKQNGSVDAWEDEDVA